MKRYIKQLLCGCLAAVCLAGCEDAEYGVAGTTVFLQESIGEAGIAGQITTVPAGGKKISLTVALSDKMNEDVTLRLTVDENALATYNKEQSSEYLLMDKELYDLGGDIRIPAGDYVSEPVEIVLHQIPEELAANPLALPLAVETVGSNVAVAPVTSKYVIAVAPVLINELAQFTSGAGLRCDDFKAFYPQYTIECRFQMSNSGNRNRFVFDNGHLSGRFEDPQNPQDGHDAHSMVQFCVAPETQFFNPELSFKSNRWQHLAATYNGKAVNIYVNGTFAGTKEFPVENAGQFDFVEWFQYGSWWWGAKLLMTELRVWSVCRSETQIQSNMKSVLPTSAGLEGYWRINKSTYDEETHTFADLTGKGHPLKASNTSIKWIPGVTSEDTETAWK